MLLTSVCNVVPGPIAVWAHVAYTVVLWMHQIYVLHTHQLAVGSKHGLFHLYKPVCEL